VKEYSYALDYIYSEYLTYINSIYKNDWDIKALKGAILYGIQRWAARLGNTLFNTPQAYAQLEAPVRSVIQIPD
jgi:hypothetical protein